DRNRSHWSTSKTPSYTKSVSWQHHPAIVDGEKGKRFHIAWCRTLDEMRHKNRFERYHATNRIDGLFEIDDGSGRSQDVDLRVCMNCLERLNYKGSIDKQRKREIFKSFSLNEFFSDYSTCFRHMPKGIYDKTNSGYVENWKEISKEIREKANGNDSNLLIVFYVQIMPDDFVMQLHR
ncbi:hypothetical protein RNP09_24710, partial [Escherichia coli]|nr:hypothetical protein [Escherichia coli]